MNPPINGQFHSRLIKTRIIADTKNNVIREVDDITTNDNGIIRREIDIHSIPIPPPRKTRKHVHFVDKTSPLSVPIDRMPTPFVPEIRFINKRKPASRKHAKPKKRTSNSRKTQKVNRESSKKGNKRESKTGTAKR